MENISTIRDKIDLIDKQIANLFEDRMNLSKQIFEYKKIKDLPIYDNKRENQILYNNAAYISDKNILPYYNELLKHIIELSKNYQLELSNKD